MPKRAKIRKVRQRFSFDCGAAVYRMFVKALTGKTITAAAAVSALGCSENHGVFPATLISAARKAGVMLEQRPTVGFDPQREIDAGSVVVLVLRYVEHTAHWVICSGSTKHRWTLIDPDEAGRSWIRIDNTNLMYDGVNLREIECYVAKAAD